MRPSTAGHGLTPAMDFEDRQGGISGWTRRRKMLRVVTSPNLARSQFQKRRRIWPRRWRPLTKIRPYIRNIQFVGIIEALAQRRHLLAVGLTTATCAGQGPARDATRAIENKVRRCQEGSILWFDMLAYPEGYPERRERLRLPGFNDDSAGAPTSPTSGECYGKPAAQPWCSRRCRVREGPRHLSPKGTAAEKLRFSWRIARSNPRHHEGWQKFKTGQKPMATSAPAVKAPLETILPPAPTAKSTSHQVIRRFKAVDTSR